MTAPILGHIVSVRVESVDRPSGSARCTVVGVVQTFPEVLAAFGRTPVAPGSVVSIPLGVLR